MTRGELSRSYADEPHEKRLTRITAETDAVYWSIYSGNLHGLGIFNLITNPKLLDLAESLVGPEIIASSVYRLRPKLPGFAHGVVPWHQDSGYFEPYCDDALVLTMWIPLVDATLERGCLRVMRRAHTTGVVPHREATDGTGYLEIPRPHLPLNDIVPVPLSLGGVLLLTNRTPHCSGDNVTDVIRWSVDVRYQSADLPTNYQSPSAGRTKNFHMTQQLPATCRRRISWSRAVDVPVMSCGTQKLFPGYVGSTWREGVRRPFAGLKQARRVSRPAIVLVLRVS